MADVNDNLASITTADTGTILTAQIACSTGRYPDTRTSIGGSTSLYAPAVHQRALSLNCGNGWVEQEIVHGGLAKEAVGVDYSEALLEQARLQQINKACQYDTTNST